MIVTTNYSEDGLQKLFEEAKAGQGDRLVGRLREACYWQEVRGKDRRK